MTGDPWGPAPDPWGEVPARCPTCGRLDHPYPPAAHEAWCPDMPELPHPPHRWDRYTSEEAGGPVEGPDLLVCAVCGREATVRHDPRAFLPRGAL